jgi:large subunit ribosomal protein L23
MKTPYEIVKRPVITEKANLQQERHNQYAFEVDRYSNKHQIRAAIEALFDVNVTSIRVMSVRGKKRRMGLKVRRIGFTAQWKKAIVTLAPDQSIDLIGEGA